MQRGMIGLGRMGGTMVVRRQAEYGDRLPSAQHFAFAGHIEKPAG